MDVHIQQIFTSIDIEGFDRIINAIMKREDIEAWIQGSVMFTYSRSSGPGGQNVNKVNTKVLAVVPLDENSPFSEAELERIRNTLSTRLNADRDLFVQSQRGRTQLENRKLAMVKLVALLVSALQVSKPRTPTRPSRKTHERRLQHKRKISEKKRRRSWRRDED